MGIRCQYYSHIILPVKVYQISIELILLPVRHCKDNGLQCHIIIIIIYIIITLLLAPLIPILGTAEGRGGVAGTHLQQCHQHAR